MQCKTTTLDRAAVYFLLSSQLKQARHRIAHFHVEGRNNCFFPSVKPLRLRCQPNMNQPNPTRCYTSSFKFSLSPLEVSRFVTLRLHCPEKSQWIALSRIQLRGYTLGNYSETEPSSAAYLPLVTSLQFIAHCLKFTKVSTLLAF